MFYLLQVQFDSVLFFDAIDHVCRGFPMQYEICFHVVAVVMELPRIQPDTHHFTLDTIHYLQLLVTS